MSDRSVGKVERFTRFFFEHRRGCDSAIRTRARSAPAGMEIELSCPACGERHRTIMSRDEVIAVREALPDEDAFRQFVERIKRQGEN